MSSTETATVRAVIENMIAAANRSEPDGQAAFFAPNATYRFRAYGIEVAGRDAVRAVFEGFLQRFPDRQLTITGMIVEGARAAVQVDFAATSPGGIPGLPEAGEAFVTNACMVCEVRDGLISSARDYLDRPLA